MVKMVSIIVPVYNAEQYLERMILSVLAQTYPHFELILIDDGSIDSSLEICQRHRDSRIKVFEQINAGVSVARNKGISVAKGDYIVFVDSDDSIEPDMLQKLMCNQPKEDELIIYGYYIHNEDKNNIITKSLGISEQLELTTSSIASNYWEYSSYGFINPPWNKLYVTSIIRNNNILFPIGVKIGEDLIFNLTYFSKVRLIKIIDEHFYHYYLYSTQTTRKVHLGIADDMIKFLRKIETFISHDKVVLKEHNNQIFKHLITALIMPYRTTDVSNRERLAYIKRTVHSFKSAFPELTLTTGSKYEKIMFHLVSNANYKMIHFFLLAKETTKMRLKQQKNRAGGLA